MSSKGSRKSHGAASTEEKEKRPAESPVKEMKKKVAPNVEKEKSSDKTVKSPEKSDKNAEKNEKVEKTPNEKGDSKKVDKHPDKNATAPEKNAQTDKSAKNVENTDRNATISDKKTEKNDKSAEKSDNKKVNDKKAEKPAEKKNETEQKEAAKVDTNGKGAPEKPKTATTNGNTNGTDTVSDEASSDEEELLIIDSQDEIFPELTYDESDVEVDDAPSRSFTRRSQVKATKTPETPRPASFKDDDSKEKLKPTDPLATDRKLRSADSPKPESKKADKKESPKNDTTVDLTEDNEEGKKEGQKEASKNKLELDVVLEIDSLEEGPRPRTRARVSPYSRARLDHTATSLLANYTGNNTTMEMDITESSSIVEDASLDSSAYLRSLRNIRGRSSYKPLKELDLSHTSRTPRNTSLNTSVSSEASRPINAVFGRKRKPSEESPLPLAPPAPGPAPAPADPLHAHSKRMRLLEHLAVPFRGFNTRRAAETCGINSDLPLSVPVAAPPAPLDPAPLKTTPAASLAPGDQDPKRSCAIV